ncbi:hypothetical protein GB937_001648 [Aspergillus fischeri]|nr:hypothetical protein GB937_001648 [Aspergillus fischeri]
MSHLKTTPTRKKSWRPKSGRASIHRKQPGCETGRSSPRTGPINRPCLRLLRNDWPKKKGEDTEAHISVPVENCEVRPAQY